MQQPFEPFALSIKSAAFYTSESPWVVKQRIRAGTYRAYKSGRRTLVELASIKEYIATLPVAQMRPLPIPTERMNKVGARAPTTKPVVEMKGEHTPKQKHRQSRRSEA